MIVDDEFIIQNELRVTLEEMGYQVIAMTGRAEEAIKKTEKQNPAIILMDIKLSGKMDGIDAAEIIKERFGTPIVFTTAFADEENIERAKLNMPFGYLIKPVKERDLKITIEMALYAAKMHKEREKLIKELQEAQNIIQTLKGLLPICASCKKIRDG